MPPYIFMIHYLITHYSKFTYIFTITSNITIKIYNQITVESSTQYFTCQKKKSIQSIHSQLNKTDSYKKIQQDATVYQNFIIPHLNEAQHVTGDIPSIIRSLKLHKQPLVLHT
jgi:glutaredoxin 2